MAFKKTFKSVASKAKKYVKKGAKAYLSVRRSKYVKPYSKTGMVSTTAIAKTLSNLRQQVNSSAEYKLLDHVHTTGSPDTSLRQFYRLQASANQATVSTTSSLGTIGYFVQNVNMPTRGDGLTNFDGKRYLVNSIQWKGTLNLHNEIGVPQVDTNIRLMMVQYTDEDGDPFQMFEFLNLDNNGEYSTQSKRNRDFTHYKVVASRNIRLSYGSRTRQDFNIFVKPRKVIKHLDGDDSIVPVKYFCVAVVSGDIASKISQVDYVGNTRLRFIN